MRNAASRSWLSRAWRNWVLVPAGYGKPIPASAADREFREGRWDHFAGAAESPRYRELAAQLGARPHPPAILDLGCGDGRLARLLAPGSYRRYLGVDFSVEGISRARNSAPPACEFVVGDFHTWHDDGPFDVIVCNESLGYADDPAAVIRRHLPSLAADGVVLVSQYRQGAWPALWRRIELPLEAVSARTVSREPGLMWDIKLLRPRHR
jgi:SAM-dependent methyltransferase